MPNEDSFERMMQELGLWTVPDEYPNYLDDVRREEITRLELQQNALDRELLNVERRLAELRRLDARRSVA